MKLLFKPTPLDLKILSLLQADCRMSNLDIAAKCGSSASSVWRRIRVMEEAGLISGFHMAVTAEALGFAETVLVYVSLNTHSEKSIEAFTQLVDESPQVMECYAVTGDHDYLLKVLATDMRSFYRFLEDTLMSREYIARTHTNVVMKKIKESHAVPVADT
jgi:DNA-binding Lrp family transcriptional regulator